MFRWTADFLEGNFRAAIRLSTPKVAERECRWFHAAEGKFSLPNSSHVNRAYDARSLHIPDFRFISLSNYWLVSC
jgi:hypothetical protein